MSSVNGIARFCTTVSESSSTARGLTMPKRSTTASQSALSVIAEVGRPNNRTSPRSGSVAPVTRLTKTSAVVWSSPMMAMCSPGCTVSPAILSGRRPR